MGALTLSSPLDTHRKKWGKETLFIQRSARTSATASVTYHNIFASASILVLSEACHVDFPAVFLLPTFLSPLRGSSPRALALSTHRFVRCCLAFIKTFSFSSWTISDIDLHSYRESWIMKVLLNRTFLCAVVRLLMPVFLLSTDDTDRGLHVCSSELNLCIWRAIRKSPFDGEKLKFSKRSERRQTTYFVSFGLRDDAAGMFM